MPSLSNSSAATEEAKTEDDRAPELVRSEYLYEKAARCMRRAERFREERRPHLVAAQLERCHWCLNSALKEYPLNRSAAFLLIGCCLAMGKLAEAKRAALDLYNSLSEEQRQELDDPVLHLAIAHTSQRLGESESAIAFLTEATDLYTQHPEPCLSLAQLLAASGRHALGAVTARSALQRSDDAVEPGPVTLGSPRVLRSDERAQALTMLGECLMTQGQLEEAEEKLLEVQRMGKAAGPAASTASKSLQVLRERTSSAETQESSRQHPHNGVTKAAMAKQASRRRKDDPSRQMQFSELKPLEAAATPARTQGMDATSPVTWQLGPGTSAESIGRRQEFLRSFSREPTLQSAHELTREFSRELTAADPREKRLPFLQTSEPEPPQRPMLSELDLISGLMPVSTVARTYPTGSGAEDPAEICCQEACRRPVVCGFFKVA